MRNALRNDSGIGYEDDEIFAEHASSPDQAAVVWSGSGEVVAASPVQAGDGTYNLDVARFPSDFNLAAALNLRRSQHRGIPQLSGQTLYLTSVPDFSERTRILALSGDVLALDDAELTEWLINAERNVVLGTDNHPVFETALEDTACSIRRLPNGQVAMTEVPRPNINTLREKANELAGDRVNSFLDLVIETPLRGAARYFLTAMKEGSLVLRDGKEREVTAFLLITRSGYSYGLWSPSTGLFSEYGFLAPSEVDERGRARSRKAAVPSFDDTLISESDPDGMREPEPEQSGERLAAYVSHAFEQLYLQLSQEKLEQLGLTSYAQVVWAAEAGLPDIVGPVALDYETRTGIEFLQIPAPVDEAVAGGLLFGSFDFGDASVAGAQILPPVNLARDLLVFADKGEIERRRMEDIRLQKRRNQALFAMAAAPVLVIAILLALFADIMRKQTFTAIRDVRAEARTAELKPALDRRKSYEANLKWYQEFITQVSRLRRQQPVGIGLLYQLNSNYPFDIDPSFYVSDMKLTDKGEVEIKGLARNKDAITSFLKALEFAGGSESGSRMFANLAYEVQESIQQPQMTAAAGQPTLPSMAGATLTATKSAPGIIAWSIKGSFVPVLEFVPPDPKAKPKAKTPAQNVANAKQAADSQAQPPAAKPAS